MYVFLTSDSGSGCSGCNGVNHFLVKYLYTWIIFFTLSHQLLKIASFLRKLGFLVLWPSFFYHQLSNIATASTLHNLFIRTIAPVQSQQRKHTAGAASVVSSATTSIQRANIIANRLSAYSIIDSMGQRRNKLREDWDWRKVMLVKRWCWSEWTSCWDTIAITEHFLTCF